MDPTQMKKIQAMNKYRRCQFLDNLYFYSLIALTCSLFCCIPLCLPYLSSLFRVFFFVQLSSKFLFIVGNLIIFVLILNSRILSASSSNSSNSTTDVYYDQYIKRTQTQTKKPQISSPEVINKGENLEKEHVAENVDMTREEDKEEARPTKEEENNVDEGDVLGFPSSSDELNKRADDFIARVNRQRRLELSLTQYVSY